MSDPPRAERISYPVVDVLRAAAALLVLVYHVIERGDLHTLPERTGLRVLHIGWIGVDLFLVISGFVITQSLLRERARGVDGAPRRFLARRLVRVVPLYAVTSVVFLFVATPSLLERPAIPLLRHLGAHALFIHNLFPGTHGSLNGVTWSLGLEMQFYVVVALVGGRLSRARVAPTLCVLVAIALLWRLAVMHAAFTGPHVEHLRFIYTTQLPGTLDAFGAGIVTALALDHGPPRVRAWLAPGVRTFAAWTTLAVVAWWATMTVFWSRASYWDDVAMVTCWRASLALTFGLVLAAAITCPFAHARVLRPLRYLGEISYGVYLWHMMVVEAALEVHGVTGVRLLVTTLVVTCALASLSWHLIERPAVARFARAARERSIPPPVAAGEEVP